MYSRKMNGISRRSTRRRVRSARLGEEPWDGMHLYFLARYRMEFHRQDVRVMFKIGVGCEDRYAATLSDRTDQHINNRNSDSLPPAYITGHRRCFVIGRVYQFISERAERLAQLLELRVRFDSRQ